MANATFNFQSIIASPMANAGITLTPLQTPVFTGSYIAVGDSIYTNTNTSGAAVFSNIVLPGYYKIDYKLIKDITTLYVYLPTSSVSLNGGNYSISSSINNGDPTNVVFNFIDFTSNKWAVKKITLSPVYYPNINDSWITVKDSISYDTDSTGSITFPTVVPGVYLVTANGNKSNTSFFISVPAYSGSVNAKDILVNPTSQQISRVNVPPLNVANGLTKTEADSLYQPIINDGDYLDITVTTAYTASYVAGDNVVGTVESSSYSFNSSNADNAYTASYVEHAQSASISTSASYSIFADISLSASYVDIAGNAGTTLITGSTYYITSSWAESSSVANRLINYDSYVGFDSFTGNVTLYASKSLEIQSTDNIILNGTSSVAINSVGNLSIKSPVPQTTIDIVSGDGNSNPGQNQINIEATGEQSSLNLTTNAFNSSINISANAGPVNINGSDVVINNARITGSLLGTSSFATYSEQILAQNPPTSGLLNLLTQVVGENIVQLSPITVQNDIIYATASWSTGTIFTNESSHSILSDTSSLSNHSLTADSASFSTNAFIALIADNATNALYSITSSTSDFADSASLSNRSLFSDVAYTSSYSNFSNDAYTATTAIYSTYAITASYAATQSYIQTISTASFAETSSLSYNSISSSHASTASYLLNFNATSSWASSSLTSSYSYLALSAVSADFAILSNRSLTASYATTSLIATNATTASYAVTASHLLNFVPSPSSSWAGQSLSASYALTASSSDVFTLRNYLIFNATSSVSHSEGRVFYDTDAHTLCVYNDRSNVTLNVGEEQWIRVINKTGTTISNGTPVTVSGSQGNRPKAILAQSHNNASEHKDFDIVGVATENILDNEEGIVTTLGIVRSIDTSNWSTGDTLYVSSSAGQITNVRPSFPYDVIKIGVSLNSTNNGSILVLPEDAIHANDISGDGQLFVTASWATSSISSSYSSTASYVNGYVPYTGSTGRVDLTPYSITASNIIHISDTAPNNPIVGKMWYDTADTASVPITISASYALIAADVRPSITTLTSNTTLNNTHNNVLVSCSTVPIYISLPSASLNNQRLFNIKKIDNTGYNVIVQTVDSSSIDDTTYKIISTQYTNMTVQSNGSQYYIL